MHKRRITIGLGKGSVYLLLCRGVAPEVDGTRGCHSDQVRSESSEQAGGTFGLDDESFDSPKALPHPHGLLRSGRLLLRTVRRDCSYDGPCPMIREAESRCVQNGRRGSSGGGAEGRSVQGRPLWSELGPRLGHGGNCRGSAAGLGGDVRNDPAGRAGRGAARRGEAGVRRLEPGLYHFEGTGHDGATRATRASCHQMNQGVCRGAIAVA